MRSGNPEVEKARPKCNDSCALAPPTSLCVVLSAVAFSELSRRGARGYEWQIAYPSGRKAKTRLLEFREHIPLPKHDLQRETPGRPSCSSKHEVFCDLRAVRSDPSSSRRRVSAESEDRERIHIRDGKGVSVALPFSRKQPAIRVSVLCW